MHLTYLVKLYAFSEPSLSARKVKQSESFEELIAIKAGKVPIKPLLSSFLKKRFYDELCGWPISKYFIRLSSHS
jgi:hypothetical protein